MSRHSKNRYSNIDRLPPSKTYFFGPVEEHVLAEVIANWFTSRGLSPSPTVSNHDFVSWSYYDAKERLAYHFGLNRDFRSRIHVTASIVFALLAQEDFSDSAVKLLRQNGWLIAPCKFCILLTDNCALKFDCHDSLITEEQLSFRLTFLFNLATHSRDEFTQEEFGLLPLPDSWFKQEAA